MATATTSVGGYKVVRKVSATPTEIKGVQAKPEVAGQKPVAAKLEATCHTTFVDAFLSYEDKKDEKTGKKLVISHVDMVRKHDQVVVAKAKLVGEWNPQQAEKEYFKHIDGKLPAQAAKNWTLMDERGDFETTTHVGLWLGSTLVAEGNVPGYLRPDDAMNDFFENSEKYDFFNGFTAEAVLKMVS